MDPIMSSVEDASEKLSDPWEWSVDEVVTYLCNPQSILRQATSTVNQPWPTDLEAKIREHEVTGLALLREVDDKFIIQDWDIASAGQRATINTVVDYLQEYSAINQRNLARKESSAANRSFMYGTPSATARHSTFFQYPASAQSAVGIRERLQDVSLGTSIRGSVPPLHRLQTSHEMSVLSPDTPTLDQRSEEILESSAKLHDRRDKSNSTPLKLHSPHAFSALNPSFVQAEGYVPSMEDGITVSGEANERANEDAGHASPSLQKRRRVAPTNIAPLQDLANHIAFDANRQEGTTSRDPDHNLSSRSPEEPRIPSALLPTSSDNETSRASTSPPVLDQDGQATRSKQDPELPRPGIVTHDAKGRKRVRPIAVTADICDDSLTTADCPTSKGVQKTITSIHPGPLGAISLSATAVTPGKKAQRNPNQTYLGHNKMMVDDLFYEENQFGEIAEKNLSKEDFDFELDVASSRSVGKQRYVHNSLKHYFLSRPVDVVFEGREATGIVPYKEKLALGHRPLSMTIFSTSANGSHSIRRVHREDCLQDAMVKNHELALGEGDSGAFKVADPNMAVDEIDGDTWKALEKWNHIGGNDHLLPVFGDSGSEGEYDDETWKEMEKESGNLEKTQGIGRTARLANDRIQEIIDSAAALLVEQWAKKRETINERKAWRLWAKAKRDSTRKLQIADCDDKTAKLTIRMEKLITALTEVEWFNEKKLRTGCQVLQPTIFDREEESWKKSILQSLQAPPKPRLKPKVGPPPAHHKTVQPDPGVSVAEGEELLISDPATTSGDDDLDDFIVSDEEEEFEPIPSVMRDASSLSMDIDNSESTEPHTAQQNPDSKTPPPLSDNEIGKAIVDASIRDVPPAHVKPENEAAPLQNAQSIVDLTQISSDVEPSLLASRTQAVAISSSPHPTEQPRPPERVVKRPQMPQRLSQRQPEIIDIFSSSDHSEVSFPKGSPKANKPDHSDVKAIGRMNVMELLEANDRRRLLIWVMEGTPMDQRQDVLDALSQLSVRAVKDHVETALKAYLKRRGSIRGMDQKLSNGMMQLAYWFVSYTIPCVCTKEQGMKKEDLLTTVDELPNFPAFYDYLMTRAKYYEPQLGAFDEIGDSLIKKSPNHNEWASSQFSQGSQNIKRRQRIQREDSDLDEAPSRKRHQRIFAVEESQDTLNRRKQAQVRMREDEARRRKEIESGALQNEINEKRGDVIVNPGKHADMKFIHLDPRFGRGRPLMRHQIEGLQFLWREITADHNDPQGCLLAHTMGLGKTIQILALLVVLACAGASADEAVRDQVPLHLQQSHTLILCPKGLVENWYDEILTWVPRPLVQYLGDVKKVSADLSQDYRAWAIRDWSEQPRGILLMPYTVFKILAADPEQKKQSKKTTKNKSLSRVDDRQSSEEKAARAAIRKILLEKPSLVVADEAHEFKNPGSVINNCVSGFETKSRIALTGSPLSNALAEYYYVIDWTTPGFLGNVVEFRATYEEPIKEGLYGDSSKQLYRIALKKLRALQIELEPKVHRAEVAALDDLLHGKNEVMIQLPLTELQTKLYSLFVQKLSATTEGTHMTFFAYLKVLQLLCHHPKLYFDWLEKEKEKLLTSKEETVQSATTKPSEHAQLAKSSPNHKTEDVFTRPDSQRPLLSLAQESLKLREGLDDINDHSLSPKYIILMRIVELSLLAGDKILIFSHRIAPLDYVSQLISRSTLAKLSRIDGKVAEPDRKRVIEAMNEGDANVCLVSTTAGGVGINLFAANRVIILDSEFNPMKEQQAVGRAYRIGQAKRVYVYQLLSGGTFEDKLLSQGKFKKELFERAVDKKEQKRSTDFKLADYIFEPRTPQRKNLEGFHGQDEDVLDHLLSDSSK